MARPVKYTKEVKKEIEQKLMKYIENTAIPSVAEFAWTVRIAKQRLYEWPELEDGLALLITKKEAMLEKLGLAGEIDKTMAIFSLKQLGWKDKVEHEQSGEITHKHIVDLPKEMSLDEWAAKQNKKNK